MTNLIDQCICGYNKFSETFMQNQIPVRSCLHCGTVHQMVDFTADEYWGWYQTYDEYKIKHNTTPYSQRYEHDYKISQIRIEKYKQILGEKFQAPILDIGAANGAFVDRCWHNKIPALGVDIRNITVNQRYFLEGNVIDNEFLIEIKQHTNVLFKQPQFSTVTLHDVLEHVIDPRFFLTQTQTLLKHQGVYIIDVPDFFHPQGTHHWRPIEHLWFFNQTQLITLLQDLNFQIHTVDYPIPGKLVIYAVNQNHE